MNVIDSYDCICLAHKNGKRQETNLVMDGHDVPAAGECSDAAMVLMGFGDGLI